MYQLTDQQIDYIINDIRARGVEMESLQNDLVDHVCCIVEEQLEATGDFEQFYATVIKTFYRKELREIEEETISLLNNKNYYTMKKVMITSGIISAVLMTAGIILKFMHAPGAAAGIVSGIFLFSFIFLPLMFILKIKEKEKAKDKILLGLGSAVTILLSLAIMFKIMHWPYANMMGMTSVGILFLLYLPINLVTGIRNPDTKINTIVSSVLLVAGCGLFLSLARSPQGSRLQYITETSYYLRNEQIFKNEQLQLKNDGRLRSAETSELKQGRVVIELCDELKAYIIEMETGQKAIDAGFEDKGTWLGETYATSYFTEESEGNKKYLQLLTETELYNNTILGMNRKDMNLISAKVILGNGKNERVTDALNNLIQVQLFVLQNERKLLSGT